MKGVRGGLAPGGASVMLGAVADGLLQVGRVAMSRLLLCGVAAWVLAAAPVRADDAEDKAVAFVEKLGGTVTRDQKFLPARKMTLRVRMPV